MEMTYGQLFMRMNPNVKVVENGTCVWIFFDEVNHDTMRKGWWDKEIPDDANDAGWISVKDDLPKEHDSIFANHIHLSKHMWAKESDNVIVYVRFPDGTGRSTEGRLQDGKWWTRVSPMLEPVVTHWMPLPTPPEVNRDED